MTDMLLDMAKEKWLKGNHKEAYELATAANKVDPYFYNVDKHYAVYRAYYVAETKKNKLGHSDLYRILGLKPDPSLSVDTITSKYCKLVKLVHPDVICSPAARGALRIITTAWEALSDESSRKAYDVGAGLLVLPRKQQETNKVERQDVQVNGKKRCAPEEDMSRRNRAKRVT